MYVYVFDFGDQIKIGQAHNVNLRLHTLEKQSGHKVRQQFSMKTTGNYELLMHKTLADYRGVGEYFTYPYEDAVSLLQKFVAGNILKPKPEPKTLLLPMDFYDRAQSVFTEHTRKEKTDTAFEAFLASIEINLQEFFEERERNTVFAEQLVRIAQALEVSVEYLVTGESDKSNMEAVIWQLESVLDDLKKLSGMEFL